MSEERRTCIGCEFLVRRGEGDSSFFACKHPKQRQEGSIKTENGRVEFISNNDPYKPFWCPKKEESP